MGFSDQKYILSQFALLADSAVATGTATASSTANSIATIFPLPTHAAKYQYNGFKVVVKTAPAANTSLQLNFLNGTTTFATLPVGTASATAGATINATMTNTAVVTTSTVTNTLANGSTQVGTVTTTTDYRQFGTATGPTVTVTGTATASAQTIGAYELWAGLQQLFS